MIPKFQNQSPCLPPWFFGQHLRRLKVAAVAPDKIFSATVQLDAGRQFPPRKAELPLKI
jgi:hypothetical protein